MHDPQPHPIPVTTPTPADDDALLIADLEQRREALIAAAAALKPPMLKVDRADAAIRRYAPLLPYAVAGVAAVGILGSLVRGRRLRPLMLIAAGIDIWKLWQSAQPLLASLPRAGTSAESHGVGGDLTARPSVSAVSGAHRS